MPHCARKIGGSGFYHAVVKGDGGRIIFEDDCDRSHYIKLLKRAVENFDTDVHAYCLMSNHVHLLLQDKRHDGSFSQLMMQVNELHAMSFQKKTGGNGHVFKGRFWSEPVETDEYFLSALRYIHANPEPAGICKAEDYEWSSYGAHCGAESFVNTNMTRNLLGDIEAFKRFSSSGGRYALPFPGSSLKRHLTSDELANIAIELLGRETLATIKQRLPPERNELISRLAIAGFTENEIVRVTGLGRQIVRSALQITKKGLSPNGYS